MIEELKKEVEVSKNIIDTLPQNNIKNKLKYKEQVEETKNNYITLLNKIIKEINKRKDNYLSVPEDNTLEEQKDKIKDIEEKLFLLNQYNTAYEKLGFDKILYELNHFYNEDLDNANDNIYSCIEIFNKAGIELSKNDFNYSVYANKYMEVLLENKGNTELIKECFETIYWQCSDLLKHIELNIKYLYYKNQNVFEKYVLLLKNDFIKKNGDNILNDYDFLVISYNDAETKSLYIGLNKFLNKELNINDYQLSKIEKCYQKFTDQYDNNIEYINEEISKASLSALEYKNYLYFSYLIDELKNVYKNKDSYKNVLKNKMKEIQKKEKNVFAYNRKLKGKTTKQKINIKLLNSIKELELLYKELDDAIFYDKVYKYLSDESSIYDALCLVCSYYLYFVKCMKNSNKSGDFDVEHQKLIQFLLNPCNNILSNIALIDDRDLPLIISDRYKLSNLKITKENLLTEDSIDEIVATAEKIDIYNKIVLKLSYDNLKFLVDVKEMLEKK